VHGADELAGLLDRAQRRGAILVMIRIDTTT